MDTSKTRDPRTDPRAGDSTMNQHGNVLTVTRVSAETVMFRIDGGEERARTMHTWRSCARFDTVIRVAPVLED